MIIFVVLLMLSGAFILLVSAIGAVRLPDFYTRANALGITDTVGTFLIFLGIALHSGFTLNSLKIILIITFIQIANPAVTHVLTRAAMRSGLKPWLNDESENRQ